MIRTRLKYFYSPPKDRLWSNSIIVNNGETIFIYINLELMTYEIVATGKKFKVLKTGSGTSKKELQRKAKKELMKLGTFMYSEIRKKKK